jgi:hypothetical protein
MSRIDGAFTSEIQSSIVAGELELLMVTEPGPSTEDHVTCPLIFCLLYLLNSITLVRPLLAGSSTSCCLANGGKLSEVMSKLPSYEGCNKTDAGEFDVVA